MSFPVSNINKKSMLFMGLIFIVGLMSGSLMTRCKASTLSQEASSFAPKSTSTPSAQIWQRLNHARWFTQGSGPHIVYLIFDPNCPYCHLLIHELQPLIKPDRLSIRYVPVGFLEPSSAGKAAAILEAKNPLNALWKNEKGFTEKGHEGAIQEILPSTTTEKALHNNLAILEATGQKTVPTMVYQDSHGKTQIVWQVLDPPDLARTLQHIH